MTRRAHWRWVVLVVGLGVAAGGLVLRGVPAIRDPRTWQAMASPGELSTGHAFLARDCAACHTPVRGVEALSCVACHANEQALLQRQPTAFHGSVQSCVGCHTEHQGKSARPSAMDHAALAKLGPARAGSSSGPAGPDARAARAWLNDDKRMTDPAHPNTTRLEATLNCFACHANQDRHRQMFGDDCANCHSTRSWSLAEFRHPPPGSTDCAQCHQAPPSHYMMHFKMVSMTVARQPSARVDQCYLCHQTNDWNDIRAVGWYKHH